MLTAIDRRLLSLSSFMMVLTHSYRMAFPEFLAVSVVVATCFFFVSVCGRVFSVHIKN